MRARLVTTREGKFINVNDVKEALRDDNFINEKLVPLLKVGLNKGENITDIVRAVSGGLIYELLTDKSKPAPIPGKIARYAEKVGDIPDLEICIKQIAAHLDARDARYIEIALDPNTNEIGWSFTPTKA